ncbi:hypothetical protein [Marinibacterium profundimaris]|uniref:Uncharacterized protein n=1 Tax=Marinibacterium profundimaris TaxID=1679460 RepID=A0A225NRP9_9RHOB|nr:hypothetical protein [Marinibacterium profundimaris]OWU77611.1 hypothetical protein ATO3_02710 [Marinibacterium profundimaris]
MTYGTPGALRNITREQLEPLWARHDIPVKRLAEALGVSRQAVSLRAKALGLPSRASNRRPLEKCSAEYFTRLWLAGVSQKDIAAACGYTRAQTVGQRRRMLGLPPRRRERCTGTRSGWGTITMDQFLEAELGRRMREDGAKAGPRDDVRGP